MSNINDYSLSQENLKLPFYDNPELEKELKNEITNEKISENFKNVKNLNNEFLQLYSDLLINNNNNFLGLCIKYNKKPFYYYICGNLINLCTEVIEYKFNELIKKKNENRIDLTKYKLEKYFNQKQFEKILKGLYKDNNKEKEQLKFDYILNELKNILFGRNKFAINLLSNILIFLKYFIKQLITVNLENFRDLLIIEGKQENEIIYFNFIFKLQRYESILTFLPNVYNINENDICNLPEESEEWVNLKKYLFKVIANNPETIKNCYKEFEYFLFKTIPLITSCFNSQFKFINMYSAVKTIFKYKLFPNSAVYDAKQLQMDDSIDPTTKLLKCGEIPLIKQNIINSCEYIACRRKLYLKREENEITLDYIKNLLNKVKRNRKDRHIHDNKDKNLSNNEINIDNNKDNKLPLYQEKIINKDDKKYYVSTRLLNHSKILFANEDKQSNNYYFPFNLFYSNPEITNETRDSIIIHIHGGGFIGNKTFDHECYLRTLSNKLKIPIIGIDYGLAPENKYPKGLNDCYQAYCWILKHMKDELNMNINKIILSGDSSGGNFILSLTFLIIAMNEFDNKNIRLPDLILALYPCCDTSIKNVNNSLINSLQDFFMNESFLQYCNHAYRDFYKEENDLFLDPSKVSENIIKKVPRIRFFLGEGDPLRDDSIRLLYKLSKEGIDVKAYDFQYYGHGFFSLNYSELRKNPFSIFCKEVNELLNEKKTDEKNKENE